MCGICGFTGAQPAGLLNNMMDLLAHRGPDDRGSFENDRVSLGHLRLSIIDLANGHQPMVSEDGKLSIVFNGEIYNYREIREDLRKLGHVFRTASDTEVLLHAYRRWGSDALRRFNGMFAFSIWDAERNELFLARDRVGIKPLYYLELNGELLFASETKALLAHPGWSRTINPHHIDDYLRYRYLPGSSGMFDGCRRLPPGHFMTFRNGRTTIQKYWSPPVNTQSPVRTADEWLDGLREVLERSVRRRLITDVSFGAYLSGGVDSSVITAMMANITQAPVETFSVGFDYEHDELTLAAETARRLGCHHHQVECRAEDMALLPEVVFYSDEPLGDAISIPMYKLSEAAKKAVTVILTGEGADEIFAGYLFHKVIHGGHLYRKVPRLIRNGLVNPLARAVPASLMNMLFRYPADLGERGKQKALDFLKLIDGGSPVGQYHHLISLFDERDLGSIYSSDFVHELSGAEASWVPAVPSAQQPFNAMLETQFDHWLPDNMLLRQDKMSMAHAIEGRVPFLDHEVIEFAYQLPENLRLRGLTGKHLLRQYARSLLPAPTAQRRKMPFYVPVEGYFQHRVFQDMVNDLLSDESTANRGIFDVSAIRRLREQMHHGEFMFVKQVFSIMCLETWYRVFVDGSIMSGKVPVAACNQISLTA
ncbi:MAG: asparagine synthase (glutamine-hydrolyzing) [Pseudomonadales bacterium]